MSTQTRIVSMIEKGLVVLLKPLLEEISSSHGVDMEVLTEIAARHVDGFGKTTSAKRGKKETVEKKESESVDDEATYSVDELHAMTVPQIKEICKGRKIKTSSKKKVELMAEVLGIPVEEVPEKKKASKKPSSKKKDVVKPISKPNEMNFVERTLGSETILVNEKSGYVFDSTARAISGKLVNEKILSLTTEDLDILNGLGIDWVPPTNIVVSEDLDDELDEEDEDLSELDDED